MHVNSYHINTWPATRWPNSLQEHSTIAMINHRIGAGILIVLTLSNVAFDVTSGQLFQHIIPTTSSLQWTGGSYQFPCPLTRSIYFSTGKYTAKNVISTRAQMLDNKLFVANPRFKPGTPATLAKAVILPGRGGLKFEAFPDWSMQDEGNCSSLQSVVDLVLDQHDILWVLDTGMVRPERKCPPKVVAFNARTGRLLKTIPVTVNLVNNQSRLQYLAVDYSSDGRCFIYITDAPNRGLIVYDVQAGRGYKLLLPKGVTIGASTRDELFLALVRQSCGKSLLYFTYLGSTHLFAIRTEVLRTGSAYGRITDIGVKSNRNSMIIGTDNGSVIFFRNEGESEAYQFDTNLCFNVENLTLVHKGSKGLLATHAIADYRAAQMRVLESNLSDYRKGHVGCHGAIQQLTAMEMCENQ